MDIQPAPYVSYELNNCQAFSDYTCHTLTVKCARGPVILSSVPDTTLPGYSSPSEREFVDHYTILGPSPVLDEERLQT